MTTVVSTTGGTDTLDPFIGSGSSDLNQGEISGFSWIQTGTFTNVSVAVSVRALDSNHPNVTAYLTNAIGPGATTANLIASKTLSVIGLQSTGPYPLATFFTGLTLPAGTYYLTMVGDVNLGAGETQNVSDGNGTPVLGSGVSLSVSADLYAAEPAAQFGGPIDTTFPPASTFFFAGKDENGGRLIVDVTAGFQAPTIQKSFGDSMINLGGSTSLSFTITNPNASGTLTGIAFTDNLPAGLTVSTVSPACGGSVSTTTTSVILAGGSLAAGGSCTFSVNVTGTGEGVKNNSVAVTSTEGGTGNTSTASLTVVTPPAISKTFGSAVFPLNGSTSLSFTIQNEDANVAIGGVAFTDTLPAGLVVANPNAASGNCGGGTVTAVAGASSISLSGGALAVGASCTISVNVTGTTAGSKPNNVAVIYSLGTGGMGSATTFVAAPATISKAFGAASIAVNGTTSLQFTLTNPNTGVPLTGVSFTDVLPAGLNYNSGSMVLFSASCGPAPGVSTFNATTLTVNSIQIASTNPCLVTVSVKGTAAGVQANTVASTSSTQGGTGGGPANASITVIAPPTIQKAFGAATIPVGGTTTLTFTINNPNASSLSGISFIDNLPFGLTIAPALPSVSGCGPGAAVNLLLLGLVVSATDIQVGASSNCIITYSNVKGIRAGIQNNITDAVSSTEGGTGTTSNTATVTVASPPSIGKAFGAATIPLNGTTTLTFTITNPNATVALNGVAFTDTLQAGLVVATTSGLASTCGGTPAASGGSVSLTGGTIAAGGSCTLSVNVTGATAGAKSNSVSVTSTSGGTGNTATASVTVVAPPSIGKAFGVSEIPMNGTTTLTFTITNPNAGTALTGVGFSDTFPAGLALASPANLSNGCGGTPATTATSVSLSGASLAASGSCTLSVSVQGTQAGLLTNNVSVTSGNGGDGTSATANITVGGPPKISKSFGAAIIKVGGSTSLSFTIMNPNAQVALTGVGFSDTLPAGLVVSTPNGLTGSCGGGAITATAGTTSISLSGATLAAAASCTFSVNVTGIADGMQNNATSAAMSVEGGNGNSATASILVANPPVIHKAFGALAIPVGSSTTLTFMITNPNVNVTLTGVGFTDTLPAGLVVATPNGEAGSCPGGTIAASGNTITLMGASLSTGASCTFSVNVTGTKDAQATNTTSAVTSDQGTGDPASATIVVGNVFSVNYAAHLDVGDSFVDFTNTGSSNGANLCVNLYAFDPAEELISCCSCSVTPNGLQSLSVQKSVINNPLTPAIPTSVVIKAIATTGACNPASVTPASLAPGALAWGTTLHQNTTGFGVTDKAFSPAVLSAAELAHITSTCGFIQSNGSGFGICKGCSAGGLGATPAQ